MMAPQWYDCTSARRDGSNFVVKAYGRQFTISERDVYRQEESRIEIDYFSDARSKLDIARLMFENGITEPCTPGPEVQCPRCKETRNNLFTVTAPDEVEGKSVCVKCLCQFRTMFSGKPILFTSSPMGAT
jgi:hypothetical protein